MTFQTWLVKQVDRDDPIGDLARDVDADPYAPGGFYPLRAYIRSIGCPKACDALGAAIREWRRERGAMRGSLR